MKYKGELVVRFKDQSEAAKVFLDNNKLTLEGDIAAVLSQQIAIGNKVDNPVTSHKITVTYA